jgi:hypothetical protein
VSRAFPSDTRSILTEMYLCHPCSCLSRNIEDGNARAGVELCTLLQQAAAAMVQGAARHQQREALAQARTREREREAQFREKLGQVRVILMRP